MLFVFYFLCWVQITIEYDLITSSHSCPKSCLDPRIKPKILGMLVIYNHIYCTLKFFCFQPNSIDVFSDKGSLFTVLFLKFVGFFQVTDVLYCGCLEIFNWIHLHGQL